MPMTNAQIVRVISANPTIEGDVDDREHDLEFRVTRDLDIFLNEEGAD